MDPKQLWKNDAWWKAIATGVGALVAKLVPILALWMGATQVQAIQQLGDQAAQVVVALGSLVIAASGLIEAAHHFSLPPPQEPPKGGDSSHG